MRECNQQTDIPNKPSKFKTVCNYIWAIFLCIFRFADIFIFFSGALVSFAINILTTFDNPPCQNIAAGLWIAASLLMILLTMFSKSAQERYQKYGGGGLSKWAEALARWQSITLPIIFLAMLLLIVLGGLTYVGII